MLVVGRRVDPLAAAPRRAHRLARAVHARGAGDRARHRLRLGGAVRRLVRARRVLRRHGPRASRELSHRAAEDSLPLRDAFAVLFFVSVGHAVRPRRSWSTQPLAVLATVRDHRRRQVARGVRASSAPSAIPSRTALTISASLAQIGEFSFILAGLGVTLGLLPPGGAGPDPRRRDRLDRAQPADLYRERTPRRRLTPQRPTRRRRNRRGPPPATR